METVRRLVTTREIQVAFEAQGYILVSSRTKDEIGSVVQLSIDVEEQSPVVVVGVATPEDILKQSRTFFPFLPYTLEDYKAVPYIIKCVAE